MKNRLYSILKHSFSCFLPACPLAWFSACLPFGVVFCFLFANPVRADVDIGSVFTLTQGKTLGSYIGPLLRAAIIGAGVIAFLLFLLGGFTVITSAGSTQKNEKGKTAITAGVAGLVVVVSAYWIIKIIEEITGVAILNPGI